MVKGRYDLTFAFQQRYFWQHRTLALLFLLQTSLPFLIRGDEHHRLSLITGKPQQLVNLSRRVNVCLGNEEIKQKGRMHTSGIVPMLHNEIPGLSWTFQTLFFWFQGVYRCRHSNIFFISSFKTLCYHPSQMREVSDASGQC